MRQKLFVTTAVVLALMLAIGVTSMAGARDGRQTAEDVMGRGDMATSGRGVSDPGNNIQVTGSGKIVRDEATAHKANTLLRAARQTDDTDLGMLYVRKVLAMDLPADGTPMNKIRYAAHMVMADLFEGVALKRAPQIVGSQQDGVGELNPPQAGLVSPGYSDKRTLLEGLQLLLAGDDKSPQLLRKGPWLLVLWRNPSAVDVLPNWSDGNLNVSRSAGGSRGGGGTSVFGNASGDGRGRGTVAAGHQH